MAGKKGRSGRKPEPDNRREKVYQIRLNEQEKKMLEKKAKQSGGTIASYIREKVLNGCGGADAWNGG